MYATDRYPKAKMMTGYNVTGGYAGEQTKQVSMTEQAMSRLHTHLNDLGVAVDTLYHRLDRVTAPAPLRGMDGAKDQSSVPKAASQLVNEIDAETQRVVDITAQLQDILNRLEV